jgi:membrane protein
LRAHVATWSFIRALYRQISGDKLFVRASGLAYGSLLATVPLIAVLFALFSAFAAFDDLKQKVQDLLFSQFLPIHQDEIVTYIEQFTNNTNRLGFFGFIFLIVTAILLLDAIEVNFNDIWHVRNRRSILNKVTAYTAVLVFATVLLGTSISITARIRAMFFTHSAFELDVLAKITSWVLPMTLTFAAFVFMYVLIPNAKVKVASAAIGALVASILWELAKSGFANSIGKSVRYSTIYGSLATVPIFLIWLYITWLILLLGLEIAFTHQRFRSLAREASRPVLRATDRLSIALQIFALIAQRFENRQEPPSCDELSEQLEAPYELIEDQIEHFADAGLVRVVSSTGSALAWVPSSSTDQIKLSDVVRSVFNDSEKPGDDNDPISVASLSAVSSFQSAGHDAIAGQTVRDLLTRVGQAEQTLEISDEEDLEYSKK